MTQLNSVSETTKDDALMTDESVICILKTQDPVIDVAMIRGKKIGPYVRPHLKDLLGDVSDVRIPVWRVACAPPDRFKEVTNTLDPENVQRLQVAWNDVPCHLTEEEARKWAWDMKQTYAYMDIPVETKELDLAFPATFP